MGGWTHCGTAFVNGSGSAAPLTISNNLDASARTTNQFSRDCLYQLQRGANVSFSQDPSGPDTDENMATVTAPPSVDRTFVTVPVLGPSRWIGNPISTYRVRWVMALSRVCVGVCGC